MTKVIKKTSSGGAKIGFSYDSNNAESETDSDDSEADSKEFLPTVCKFNFLLFKKNISYLLRHQVVALIHFSALHCGRLL